MSLFGKAEIAVLRPSQSTRQKMNDECGGKNGGRSGMIDKRTGSMQPTQPSEADEADWP